MDLLNQLKPWLLWVHLHPGWVFGAVFLLTFIECLAVIGLIIPGTVFMTVLGALLGSHVVSAKIIFTAAFLGSFIGDVTSFSIGYYYREQLREMWPFKFYPKLLQKGEDFFYAHGGKGIFIGRFIGPIRPLLPIIAGMLNMKPWRFLIADSISAIFWAPVYMFPGIILGAASVELPPAVAMHLMFYVILSLLFLWCISWVIKRFISWLFMTFHNLLDKLWAVIKHKSFLRLFHIALQDPLYPENHSQLTLGLYFIVFLSCFIFISWDVLHQGIITAWNMPLLFLLRSLHYPTMTNFMIIISLISEPKVWMGVFCAVFLFLIFKRAWRTAIYWGLLGILGFGGGEILKQIIHSPRPTGLWLTPTGYSFPSGHVFTTVFATGFFSVLLARELPKNYHWIAYTFSSLLVLFVAFSRLYLGVHWLSDIIGGVVCGITLVMFIALNYFRHDTPKISPVLLIGVFLISWGVFASVYTVKNYVIYQKYHELYIPEQTLTQKIWWQNKTASAPLFRVNRMGAPVQVLNIQWVGNLELIEENLQAQGWNIEPTTTVGLILARLNKADQATHLPILSQLYLNQPPVLVMTKVYNNTVLILYLWDGKILFTDSNLPLWVGNIDYYHPGQTGFFHHNNIKLNPVENNSMEPAMEIFKKDLYGYYYKQQNYVAAPELRIKSREERR